MDCGCAGVSLPFLDFFHPKENHRGALGRYCDGVRLFLHHCTFLERRHFTSRNTVNPKPDLRHSSSAILSVFHEITQNREWEEISKTFVKLIVTLNDSNSIQYPTIEFDEYNRDETPLA